MKPTLFLINKFLPFYDHNYSIGFVEVGAAEVEFVEEKGQTKQASGQNVHFLMHFRSISAKRFAPYGY